MQEKTVKTIEYGLTGNRHHKYLQKVNNFHQIRVVDEESCEPYDDPDSVGIQLDEVENLILALQYAVDCGWTKKENK